MRLVLILVVSSLFCQFAHAERFNSIPDVSYFSSGLQSPNIQVLGQSLVTVHPNKNISVSRLQTADIQKAFAWLKSSNLPFLYPKDCCHSRAHLMSKWLSDKNILTAKIFVVGDLLFKSPFYGNVSWDFHVAPAVLNEKKEWIVLDPSTQSGPVTYEKWYWNINQKRTNAKVYFVSPYVYQPERMNTSLDNWDKSLISVANLELLGCESNQSRAIRSGKIRP